jgi:hypothetical protein
MTMRKTLKERLNKLPPARRAKVEARTDELVPEENSLTHDYSAIAPTCFDEKVGALRR